MVEVLGGGVDVSFSVYGVTQGSYRHIREDIECEKLVLFVDLGVRDVERDTPAASELVSTRYLNNINTRNARKRTFSLVLTALGRQDGGVYYIRPES